MTMAGTDKPQAALGRIGVVLCTCASTLARQLDFDYLKKVALQVPGVCAVDGFGALCGKDGAALAERLKAQAPEALVVLGCSEELIEPQLAGALAGAGLAPNMLAVANVREQCRGLSGPVATAKAAAILRQAISRARLLRPVEEQAVEMTAAVLVVGGGWTGLAVAAELSRAGLKVAVAEQAEEIGNPARQPLLAADELAELNSVLTAVRAAEMPVLTGCEITRCRGVAGSFEVRLRQNGPGEAPSFIEGRVGAVVLAPSLDRVAPFAAYGLSPGETVLSASQFEELLATPKARAKLAAREGLAVAFLLGLSGAEVGPAATERTIKSALAVVREGARALAYVFTRDMRMAAHGLEALALEARQAGVVFFKFTDGAGPRIEQEGGAVKLTFTDEILTEELELAPDMVVVAEEWRPAAWLSEAAEKLGLAPGPRGFAQADNVHLLPVASSREGIFVVGPARGALSLRECWEEAQVAASHIKTLLGGSRMRPVRATVNRGKCTICLTCARMCPHGAIGWDNRALVMPAGCQGCGICAAECPMEAIQLTDASDAQVEAQLAAWGAGAQVLQPRLVSFCCQRSAYEAMGLAVALGHVLPPGLQVVRVPCAGKVDVDYILKAFETGADGVMVIGCHEDNCRSLRGNTYASWRVEAVQRMLAEVGLEPERVAFATVASNMGSEFARLVGGMEERLAALSGRPPVTEVRPEGLREAAGGK